MRFPRVTRRRIFSSLAGMALGLDVSPGTDPVGFFSAPNPAVGSFAFAFPHLRAHPLFYTLVLIAGTCLLGAVGFHPGADGDRSGRDGEAHGHLAVPLSDLQGLSRRTGAERGPEGRDTPDAVITTNPGGVIASRDQAAQSLCGDRSEEVVGRSHCAVLTDFQFSADWKNRLIERQSAPPFDTTGRRKDGRRRRSPSAFPRSGTRGAVSWA